MSNQPAPTRPWFRLASISRSPLQEPSPTLEQATVRPTFRPAVPAAAGAVSSVPTSPAGRVSQPSPADKRTITATAAAQTTYPLKTTTSSLPSSPAKRDLTTTSGTSSLIQKPASPMTTTTRMPSPKASTTTVRSAIHNQIQSPQTKPPISRPHSPLTLPSSQLKAQSETEQKTMLVEKTIDKPKGWLFGTPQKDFGETKEKGRGKKYSSDSNDAGVRIITISGDNQGAFMKVTQSPHKNWVQKNANSSSEASDDRKMKAKSNSSKIMPTNAFINSNVQGINNSIVCNSSCTEHNPGVHLTLYS